MGYVFCISYNHVLLKKYFFFLYCNSLCVNISILITWYFQCHDCTSDFSNVSLRLNGVWIYRVYCAYNSHMIQSHVQWYHQTETMFWILNCCVNVGTGSGVILTEWRKKNRIYRKRIEKPLLEGKREEEDKNVNRK